MVAARPLLRWVPGFSSFGRAPLYHLPSEEVAMNRKGFTLIELLIVVVIIGILAAIAIPKFANTKEKAYIASMKSDLRNLVTAEEAYFADSVKYSTNLGTAYAVTSGNTTPVIALSADGWTASISNANTKIGRASCRERV